MNFNADLFEQTINEILPGLSMYVRDVNLPEKLANRYVPDTIIMERGFTDASSRVMGMKTSHRFSILSNHMADLSEFEHGTNWGLCVATSNSHFLILDKYEYHGKTQITLLHLPNDKRWNLFQNVKVNIFDDIIKDTRNRFENKCELEVIPELETDEWLARCSAPLGMDDEGNLFDLEVCLNSRLRNIGDTNFRVLYHQIVFIKTSQKFKERLGKKIEQIAEEDGFLAYGYIDDEAGLSFRILCPANIRDNKMSRGDFIDDVFIIIQRGQLNDCEYMDMDYCDINVDDFNDEIKIINDNYKCSSEQTEEMRKFTFLDGVRSTEYPDDIQVILYKDGMQLEQVWVKCWSFTEDKLFGKLLNEPDQNYGIHCGSIIGFTPIKQDDEILCVYTGECLK